MIIKNDQELEKLKAIARVVAHVRDRMGRAIEPGMTTLELDNIGRQMLDAAGARSAPELCYKFPGATCISVNHQVAHGIPGAYVLQPGDLVNIDVSAEKDGFFGDTGASFCLDPVSDQRKRLCREGYKLLMKATEEVRTGKPVNRIGWRLQKDARKLGYSLIQNLGSHGVGRSLHEEPTFIAPYPDPKEHRVLQEGMVITIEPFLSTGATEVDQLADGWTLATHERFDTVQYEHTMVVTRRGPMILTFGEE